MNVGFNGLLRTEATFEAINPIIEGTLVKVTGNGIVDKSVGDHFSGIVTKDEDRFVSVQLKGYMEVPYDGDAPAYGITQLKSSSSGAYSVQKATSGGTQVTVLYVDTENSVVGFIL